MILVFCPKGHVFKSRAFAFGGNVRGLRLRGNRETCPRCGSMAEIMDGEFDIIDGTVRILSAPQLTFDRLQRLHSVVSTLRAERADPEKVATELEKEAPGLGRFAPKTPEHLIGYLGFLLGLLALLMSMSGGRGVPVEDVQKLIETVIEHGNSPQPTQTVPPPQPPASQPSPPIEPPPPSPGQTPQP